MDNLRAKIFLAIVFMLFSHGNQAQGLISPEENLRDKQLLDDNWKFHRGGYERAYKTDLDDSDWREIDLPHDWSIEDIPSANSPFDPNAVGQTGTGFTKGGTSWYRKSFILDEKAKELIAYLQFDGIYMDSEVWLNGVKLGRNPYGYTSFWFDISEGLKYGEENVIAVKVKNEGENSRWYSGSGIYRHVWLTFMNDIHVEKWGTQVISKNVSESLAEVVIGNRIKNETPNPVKVVVRTLISDSNGDQVAETESEIEIQSTSNENVIQIVRLESPRLWSVAHPELYVVQTTVFTNGEQKDKIETNIGIRSIQFDPELGFLLNGKSLELKGGNVHHDNGPLGAKAFDRAEERKVELLKANGYNAIRSAHNPPSPAFLDACDKLGMLVVNEAFDMWDKGKNSHDYHLYFEEFWRKDISSMIKRDFNHPSIIMWGIGNEIPEMDAPETVAIARNLADYVRELDSSRPVTAAVNGLGPEKDDFFNTLDVAGYNYAVAGDHGKADIYGEDHERIPNRIMYGSESYPLESFDSWMAAKEKPYVIGDFVWTSFDYLGEASIGWLGYPTNHEFYPWTLAFCGDLDICGWKRPQSYYRDAFWGKDRALSLFVKNPTPSFEESPERASWSKWHFSDLISSWNWMGHEGEKLEVVVFSSYDNVELFLNNKSLGTKVTNRDTKNKEVWEVPYAPGKLEAVGYINGERKSTYVLTTAGKPIQLQMKPDKMNIKADGQDLSYITVEVQDSDGFLIPDAENLIQFEIEGPGTIVGVGNANPISTESYIQSERKAWRGKCLVIIKSEKREGLIRLQANSKALESSTIEIKTTNDFDAGR
jgi:beta-galactosidase